MSNGGKAVRRRQCLVRREQWLAAQPPAPTGYARDRQEAELDATRWALRVIDAAWETAVQLVHGPEETTD